MFKDPGGGGTRTPPPPPPRLTGHPGAGAGGQRVMRSSRSSSRMPMQPKSTISIAPRRSSYRSTGSSNRTASLGRRISRSNSGGSRPSAPSSPPSSASKVITPAAPPKPVAPDVNSYLKGDSTYQRQLAAYAKSLSDFQVDQNLATTDQNTSFQNTRRDIGLSKTDAQNSLQNDFASRGLLQSSLYNTDLGKLNQQYQNQFTDLDKQRTQFLSQLGQELNKYTGEQGVQKQNAQQEALRRRAEKYNLP